MLTPVFGAYEFGPSARESDARSCVGYPARPGSRKCALILNCELELQVLASVIGVEVKWLNTGREPKILFRIPFQGFFRQLIVNKPIAFHDMQSLGMRRAVHVDHSERSISFDSNGVDHQGIPFVTADGMSAPGWRHVRGTLLIQTHLSERVRKIKQGDLVRLLQHLHSKIEEDEGYGLGPTLIVRSRRSRTAYLGFTALLQDFCRPKLQDWTGVVADQLPGIAHSCLRSGPQARPVRNRTRT